MLEPKARSVSGWPALSFSRRGRKESGQSAASPARGRAELHQGRHPETSQSVGHSLRCRESDRRAGRHTCEAARVAAHSSRRRSERPLMVVHIVATSTQKRRAGEYHTDSGGEWTLLDGKRSRRSLTGLDNNTTLAATHHALVDSRPTLARLRSRPTTFVPARVSRPRGRPRCVSVPRGQPAAAPWPRAAQPPRRS